MKKMIKNFSMLTLLVAMAAIFTVSSAAAAPLNSTPATVLINAKLGESVTVVVNSGATVSCPLAPNTVVNSCTSGSSITTGWVLAPGRASVTTYAYFASAAAALTGTAGNPVVFPSKAVSIQVGGAGAFSPMSNLVPVSGGQASGLQIAATAITNANLVSNRIDALAYQIDTTQAPTASADTYSGTVNIQAQATP